MPADAERVRSPCQALAVDLSLEPLHLGMRDPDDQIERLWTDSHDLGHGLDHVLQPFSSVDQPEGANYLTFGEPKPDFLAGIAFACDNRDAVGNDLNARSRHAINVA